MTRRSTVYALSIVTFLLVACGPNDSDSTDGTDRLDGYVNSEPYSRLTLEVDAVDGLGPREASANWLTDKLDGLVDKPDGVEVTRDGTLEARGGDHVWTFEQLDQLADDQNTLSTDDDTIKMHVLFVDGSYEEDTDGSRTLGLAWGHQNIVIFAESLEESCESQSRPGLSDSLCRHAEQSVWLHEVGHVLGLVDNGAPETADHHDADHGAHCTNDECVMHWRYEGAGIFDRLSELTGSESLNFDADCRSDLEALKGE